VHSLDAVAGATAHSAILRYRFASPRVATQHSVNIS